MGLTWARQACGKASERSSAAPRLLPPWPARQRGAERVRDARDRIAVDARAAALRTRGPPAAVRPGQPAQRGLEHRAGGGGGLRGAARGDVGVARGWHLELRRTSAAAASSRPSPAPFLSSATVAAAAAVAVAAAIDIDAAVDVDAAAASSRPQERRG